MSGSGPILVPDTEKRQMSAWGGHLSFSYFKVKKFIRLPAYYLKALIYKANSCRLCNNLLKVYLRRVIYVTERKRFRH